MAKRVSKYEGLKGQVFNGVKVVDTKMVEKVSGKTGNPYNVRRLWVTADDINTLEIGTQSWNKMSFLKRLDKITTKWVFTDEWVKEEDDAEFKVDSFEDTIKETVDEWYSDWRFKREIDDLHEGSLAGKDLAQHSFEHLCKLISEDDNMNIYGQTIWKTKEELFELWNSQKMNDYEERLEEALDEMKNCPNSSAYDYAYRYATVHEWKTEFSKKLWDFIESEWANLEERRRKAQQEWRNKHWGSDWEERWERRNFSGFVEIKENEFTVEFKECKTVKDVKRVYRQLAKANHSDLGGSDEKMAQVNLAYEQAMQRVA